GCRTVEAFRHPWHQDVRLVRAARASHRQGDRSFRDEVAGPGTRNDLRANHRGRTGNSGRPRRGGGGRHGHGAVRARHLRKPVDANGWGGGGGGAAPGGGGGGDTAPAPSGLGPYESRSTPTAGAAGAIAARKVRDKARKIAAHLLEVSEEDLVWEPGKFSLKGAPQKSK